MRIPLLLLFFGCTYFASGQIAADYMPSAIPYTLAENSLAHYHLKKDVRSCEYHYFKATRNGDRFIIGEETENPEILYSYQMTFTPLGYVQSVCNLRELNGRINFTDTLRFNAEGLPIEMARYQATGRVKFQERFVYDDRQLLVRWESIRDAHVQDAIVYTYTPEGRLHTSTHTNLYHPEPHDHYHTVGVTHDIIENESTYLYDREGKLIHYTSDELSMDFSYDNSGTVEKIARREGSESVTRIQGDSIVESFLTESGEHQTNVSVYNAQDDPIEKKVLRNDVLILREIYEYIYDAKGNWTQRCYYRQTANHEKSWCDQRILTYYDEN